MNKKSSKGFTLVELAIVLGVVGVLVAVLVPSFISILAKSKENNRLERVTTARDAIFYEDPELATQSDMRGYLFKIEDSIYEVSNTGELVLSDYDLNEYDIEDYEKVTTKDNISGVEIFKPSAVTAFNRALRARNHYHSKHGLMTKTNDGNVENVFYEMNHFVIIVYDNDIQADVGYEVTYAEGLDGNGKLIPTDKTIESLKEQGLEYTTCTCEDCVMSQKDSWQGIVCVPTDLTKVYLRVLALEEEISNSTTIDWDDGNIKASNFVYEVDGEMYCIDAENKVYRCESDLVEDIQDEGYTSLCQNSISNLSELVIEANRNKKAYKTVNCYAVRYGYYDSNSIYHTWTEFKGIYNGGSEVNNIEYKEAMSGYDIRKLILADTVTKISDKAFTNYSKLVDLVIPESVTDIEVLTKNPFANGKLTTIRVNNKNVNFYDYKNQSVIETETQKLIKGSDSLLDETDALPATIKEIGNYAFEGSDVVSVDLTKYTVSDTKTYVKVVDKLDHMGNPVYKTDELGNYVYETNPETGKLEKVVEQEEKTITEQIQVNKFGKGIFKDCELLSRVVTNVSITEIPEEMFSGCITLSDFETKEYLEVIGSKAFEGCVSLTKMEVYLALNQIGENAFDGCDDTLVMYYEDSRKTFEAIVGAYNAIDNIKELVCELKDIEYNLNGGELPKGALANPTKFDPDESEILSLIAPEREGAIFRSWSVVATYYPEVTFADITDSGSLIQPYQFMTDKYNGYDVTLTANYERVVFNINYEINSEDVTNVLDDEYKKTYNKTLNTTIYLPKYEKNYYEFDGWYCDSVHLGEYLLQSDYAKDLILTATYTPAKYNISYDYNGGQVDNPETDEIESNPATYTIEDENFTLIHPVREDYTFSSWTKIAYYYDAEGQIVYVTSTDGEITQNVMIEKGAIPYHLSLKANYVATEYNLSYQESDGTEILDSGNPTKFTILSGVYELNAPSDIKGYDFVGWKVGNDELENNEFICGEYHGDTVITAIRNPWKFTVTYTNRNDNGVTGDYVQSYEPNPTDYDYGTTVRLYMPTMKTGYRFVEWIDDNGKGNVVYDDESGYYYITGGESDLRICAKWEIITYRIDYDRDDGTDVVGNKEEYDVEDDAFVINDVEKLGYEFLGWTGDGITEPQKNILIDCSSTFGDKFFEAHFDIIEYDIIYTGLEGATVYGNPDKYTVETEFSLNQPIRDGFTFKGWTGTNCNEALVVQVTKGNTGERNYNAIWVEEPYTITYYLDGGTNHLDNPAGYTVTSETFEIKEAEREGYEFKGWTGTGLDGKVTTFKIEQGSIGDRVYTANWEEIEYEIKYYYVLDNGEPEEDTNPINKTKYTITTESFTLEEPTRIGYEFKGWEGTELNGKVNSVEISNETGDREYTYYLEAEEYTIKYDYRGGTVNGTNVTLYSVATPTFTVINPERTGYEFIGWTEEDETAEKVTVLTITQGVTAGNKEFIAHWKAIDYTITLDYADGETTETITYNIEDDTTIEIGEISRRG
ncbi:MAG: InlB B-repeat-containing protein, partial [Clostridia bacterium]|nr:InlB B-repeat-containing protein [Clostridia bacterium]